MNDSPIFTQNVVACVWDFDKTLINGYMQKPLFTKYKIDDKQFWKEVNQLPELYAKKGLHVSQDTVYLNHLLSYIKNGPLKGLRNSDLRELGKELQFFPGLPHFFSELKSLVRSKPEYIKNDIVLEHYVISTGLAETIRGSAIAEHVENIYGCEFIETPFPPNFSLQPEFDIDHEGEISQIGTMVDNTIKTRYIFEINKGTNKNSAIDVNSNIRPEDRRIPIQNMIYVADGPSDVPVFSVVKKNGGKTYAVYDPTSHEEFAQNDNLLQVGRIHAYGPADYRSSSSTHMWLKMHILSICDKIVRNREYILEQKVVRPPRHLHKREAPEENASSPQQGILFGEEI